MTVKREKTFSIDSFVYLEYYIYDKCNYFFYCISLKSTFPYPSLGSVFLMKIRRFIFIVCAYFMHTCQKVYGYEKPLLNVNKTFPHE